MNHLLSAITISKPDCKEEFISEISELIIKEFEPVYIKKFINANYSNFAPSDREAIIKSALDIINSNDSIMNSIYHNRRKTMIEKKLLEYFQTEDTLILEGFINFRLHDYKYELEEICEKAFDKFIAYREYEDFLELLRFYVSTQSPLEDLVHIKWDENKVKILNKRKKDISQQYIYKENIDGEALTQDDLILSALIAISPSKIILHNPPNDGQLIKTIRLVFGSKIK